MGEATRRLRCQERKLFAGLGSKIFHLTALQLSFLLRICELFACRPLEVSQRRLRGPETE